MILILIHTHSACPRGGRHARKQALAESSFFNALDCDGSS